MSACYQGLCGEHSALRRDLSFISAAPSAARETPESDTKAHRRSSGFGAGARNWGYCGSWSWLWTKGPGLGCKGHPISKQLQAPERSGTPREAVCCPAGRGSRWPWHEQSCHGLCRQSGPRGTVPRWVWTGTPVGPSSDAPSRQELQSAGAVS